MRPRHATAINRAHFVDLILFLEHLTDHEIVYIEKSLVLPCRVTAVIHDGFRVRIGLRIDQAQASVTSLRQDFRIGGALGSFVLYDYVLRFSAGYGIGGTLVYHPAAISWVREQCAAGMDNFDVMRIARDNFKRLPDGELPPAKPGGVVLEAVRPGQPRCLYSIYGANVFVHFRDHGDLGNRVQTSAYPLSIIMELCERFRDEHPGLLENLCERDQQYVAANPGVAATIARSSQDLFTDNPDLALLYHIEHDGLSLNANLSNEAAIRILGWIGEICGFVVQPLDPARVGSLDSDQFSLSERLVEHGQEVQISVH